MGKRPKQRHFWGLRAVFVLVAVLLLAFNLRTAIASVSPIAELLTGDIPIGGPQFGILGMLPAVAFATAGLFSAPVATALGYELTLTAALGVMALAHVVRVAIDDFVVFFICTALILLMAGVGGVLLPPYVKREFGTRAVAISSVYLCAISLSAALPPVLAVPVATGLGWRFSLLIWGLLAAFSTLVWFGNYLLSLRKNRGHAIGPTSVEPGISLGRILGSRVFWGFSALHGFNTFFSFTVFAWLPIWLAELTDLGPGTAGWLLGMFAIITVPMAFIIPRIMRRMGRSHSVVYFFSLALVLGWGGMLLSPNTLTPLWVVLLSIGTGLFVVYQVFLIERTNSSETTAKASGYSQTIGFVFGSSGPPLVGWLHTVTGSWDLSLAVLLCMAFLVLFIAPAFSGQRVVDPEPRERQPVAE